MVSEKISLNDKKIFHELDSLNGDRELARAVRGCAQVQRKAAGQTLKTTFKPESGASEKVSDEALGEILKKGGDINGIRTEKEISNVVVFNDKRYENAALDQEVSAARKKVDHLIGQKMKALFVEGNKLEIRSSGFFLYPPQGYMGWHTNWQNPGWRLYVNYAEEPGKSFFRYRDPDSGEIVTSVDRELNFRLFRAIAQKPFWHAVYSETYRYSLGYKVSKAPGFFSRLKKRFA